MNKKLKKLATTLKEMGEKEASHKVLSMLDDALPIKGAGSKKEETDENKGGELSPLEKLHKLIKEGPKARPKPEETESSKPEETESSKSEKTRPKSNKKKSSLKVGSKDKRRVRRLQKALMKAGFDLPRFGADGLFGRETKSAVIKFKKKAAADGRYSGEFDEIVDNKTLELVEAYVLSGPKKSARGTEGNFVLYIGDSQMGGSLGAALTAAGGSGKKLSKSGSNAAYWVNHTRFTKLLAKEPSKIIISLNGNNIAGTGRLIKKIMKHNSKTPVIWTGAPPPIKRKKSSYSSVTSNESFARLYDKRNKWNKTVEDMVPSHWTFINPYTHIKYAEPKRIGLRTFESGYECKKCDGIHLPSAASREYVSSIEGLLA